MHERLWFTTLLNAVFGKPALALLHFFHLQPADATTPIPNYVAMEILVALLIMSTATILGRRLSVDSPRGGQHIFEWLWIGLKQQAESVIGHSGSMFMPFLTTLTLFLVVSNLLGLFPTVISPTAHPSVPLGCALVSFVVYNWAGSRHHGVLGYAKHFMGPMPSIARGQKLGSKLFFLALGAILILPIEIISNCARVLSLTVRLFANMFAGDMVTVIMVALLPISGIIFMGLHTFVGLLQTFIFVLLTMVYLAGAVAEEH